MIHTRIAIAVPTSHFLRWHERLRDSLAARWPAAEITFRFSHVDAPHPPSVMRLIAMERRLIRRGAPTLCDRLETPSNQSPDAAADIVIDLAGDQTGAGEIVLRPLYDGHPTDQAAVAALLSHRAPGLAVEDAGTGAIVAEGLPSLEGADCLVSGLEAVYSRVAALLEKAVANPRQRLSPVARVAQPPAAPLAYLMRNVAFQCGRALYHLCCHSPHWRVGWRFTQGPGVLETGAIGGGPWRIMDDRNMDFAADPFPIDWRGRLGVFYERLDYRTNLGEIWYQPFDETGPAGRPIPAITEPWHLSYPFLIEEDGVLYMLPEASASGAVTLYRCVSFPDKWEPVARLLDRVEAADATIFRHDGRYWMTSVVRQGVGGYSDTLALHHATSLFGPWEAHARNPVIIDSRFARPAGAVVATPTGLYRPAQDCSEGYGMAMTIMRIDRLDPETFAQSCVSRISPGAAWPGARLHTVNRCGTLECIDGAIFAPKYLPLRRLTQEYIDRRKQPSNDAARPCGFLAN